MMEDNDSHEVICLSDSEDVIMVPEKVSSKNQEVLINIESDNSSGEDNVNFSRKKVTRRGLKLDDFVLSNTELEEELESSNIYTSRVDLFRKERKNFHENFPALLSSIPQSNDVEVSDKESEEHENVSNARKKLCVNNVNNSPVIERKSPSPPPLITALPINFSKRINRKANKILSEMENSKLIYNANRKKYNFEKSQELNCDLLDINYQRTLIVKFRWQGTILRIPMKMTQKFATILPELAEKCKADISDIFLVIKEENIKAEDSPDSHNLTSADIIECYIVKSSNLVNDENKINLQIQASDSRKKVTISINKLSPMSRLMEEYAKQRDISLEKLKFMFDGELLKSTDTPVDLEMENDNCIDVTVFQ